MLHVVNWSIKNSLVVLPGFSQRPLQSCSHLTKPRIDIIENYLNGDSKKFHRYFPHPQSLSRMEREDKPFSLREKGGDEGGL